MTEAAAAQTLADTLVFGWGNPSRGDDALGPLFIEHLGQLLALHPEWGAIDLLTDFQLQVEHALDLQGRRRVLFVDARIGLATPCHLEPIAARRDDSFSTHAMSPQSVLAVYREIEDAAPPPAWLLSIRGESFELGEAPGAEARVALVAALERAAVWIETGR